MLQVNKLNAGYERYHILFDISMECSDGQIVGVLGPNGSGKTTLLNSIFGFADVFSGSIKLDGEEIVGLPPHKIARKSVAYLLQMFNIFPELTVRENLKLAAAHQSGNMEDSIARVLEIFPDIKPFMNRKAGTLSGGERQMLALSMILIKSPKLLLLDEPTTGLSPLYVSKILDKIVEINRAFKTAIVLVEQNVMKALEIVEKVYLIVGGKVIFKGNPSDLLSREDLLKLYLGAIKR